MPPPINIDAANAFDLGTLPVDFTQDVFDAGTTYSVWYYTDTIAGFNELGIWGLGNPTLIGYKPTIFVYTGTPGFLDPYVPTFGTFAQNKPIQIPVTVGTRYYFEFRKNGNFNPSPLRIRAEYFNNVLAPANSLFISDDTQGYPGVIISSIVDYQVLRYIFPFPAGEAGDKLNSSGRMLVADEFVDFNLKLYENNFNFIANVGFTWNGVPRIKACQGANKWYVGDSGGGGNNARVQSVTNNGILSGTVYDLGTGGLTALAAKNDETILYYSGANGAGNNEIKRWDLVTNSPMSDIVPNIGIGYIVTDILYLADNTILVEYFRVSPREIIVKRYSLTGLTLNTYNMGGGWTSTIPRMSYALDDPTTFWLFLHPSGSDTGKSNFKQIDVATGTTLVDRFSAEYETGAYEPAETLTPFSRFGNSFSCPFWPTSFPVGTPITGTIIINKTTTPSGDPTSFLFNAGGGLTPNSFSLSDGQTQQYNNVPVGIYSIEEVVPAGWTVEYDVSDGSPPSALNLGSGEVLIINVTNSLNPNERSGIYKIVPGKRNDTLWNNLALGTTTTVKIPNPRIKTGLFGE